MRVEAVNLDWFIYDTADLSTARGGSQLLDELDGRIRAKVAGLEAISTGASAVLYRVTGDAKDSRRAVRDVLSADAQLKHGTFVVDIYGGSGDFAEARERLLALNRHRQMRAPSLAVPTLGDERRVCELDGVRPAKHRSRKGPKELEVSDSVGVRREYGKEEKRALVRETADEIGLAIAPSEDFEDIAIDDDGKFGNLGNKMAVLFLDGNDFGAIQNEVCRTPKTQKAFDEALQARAKEVLRTVMKLASARPERWQRKGRLRLEVLMLAGDEIRLVAPAWCGWEALAAIFETLEKAAPVLGKKLSWKAGLVFCHHHAPIQRMLTLADSLAGYAKRSYSATPMGNVFCYRALESFDAPGGAVPRMLPTSKSDEVVFGGQEMREIARVVEVVKKRFPRNKAHRIVELLSKGNAQEAEALIEKELGELAPVDAAAIKNRTVLKGSTGWLHFVDLADYAGY